MYCKLFVLIICCCFCACGSNNEKPDQQKKQEFNFVIGQRRILDSIAESGEGKKINFSSLGILNGTSKNILVFRHDYSGCDYCADSSLSLALSWAKLTSHELKIISNLPPENILSWKKGHGLSMNVYFEADSLSLPSEQLNSSYLFAVNKNDSIVSKVFIPTSNDLILVKDFLKAIE